MEGTGFWSAALLASALVGMGKGGFPALAMLAVPVLSLAISPVTAAGLLLPVYVLSDVFGLYAYRRGFDRSVLAILVPGMLAGVGVGWATARIVPEAAVTALVGVIGLAFALYLLLRRKARPEPQRAKLGPGLFWGVVSGFTSFVSHAGAPPFQVYTLPLGLSKTAFAATATVAFAIVNAAKLLPYWHLGQLSPANLQVAVVLMPVAVASVFVGVRLVRWLPEALFFRLVTWALLVVSLKLIWDGITV